MPLLTLAASTSAQASAPAQRCASACPSAGKPLRRRNAASTSSPAVAPTANNHGMTEGDGPGAKGLSQGRVMRKITARACMIMLILMHVNINIDE